MRISRTPPVSKFTDVVDDLRIRLQRSRTSVDCIRYLWITVTHLHCGIERRCGCWLESADKLHRVVGMKWFAGAAGFP